MTLAVLAHWAIEMLATLMYMGLAAICVNPKHGHNKVLVWIGNHKLLTQAVLAIPMAWITVKFVDAVLLGGAAGTDSHDHHH